MVDAVRPIAGCPRVATGQGRRARCYVTAGTWLSDVLDCATITSTPASVHTTDAPGVARPPFYLIAMSLANTFRTVRSRLASSAASTSRDKFKVLVIGGGVYRLIDFKCSS